MDVDGSTVVSVVIVGIPVAGGESFIPVAGVNLSYLSSGWNMRLLSLSGNLSIIDDLLWSFVSIVESLAIVTTICCFFLFCGCTL
ncbi:hypothetical protein ARALYDRAFT_917935 [Arabidopsis lyrata subsp. lyrata]|uniref:Uncharacterized protein n=1 Tax=Arabidopsis lyrata subsp. lyrata TaxID=81972 RepID=D7MNT6_ARALL|nr:hypothetical protein ARALYDRAFT_917935 [Arabidopsis lyrata subsp. lyrata]